MPDCCPHVDLGCNECSVRNWFMTLETVLLEQPISRAMRRTVFLSRSAFSTMMFFCSNDNVSTIPEQQPKQRRQAGYTLTSKKVESEKGRHNTPLHAAAKRAEQGLRWCSF